MSVGRLLQAVGKFFGRSSLSPFSRRRDVTLMSRFLADGGFFWPLDVILAARQNLRIRSVVPVSDWEWRKGRRGRVKNRPPSGGHSLKGFGKILRATENRAPINYFGHSGWKVRLFMSIPHTGRFSPLLLPFAREEFSMVHIIKKKNALRTIVSSAGVQ